MSAGKGKQYGKDSTRNPAVSKFAGLSEGLAGGVVSWAEVDGRAIKAAIAAATEAGAAIILSKTSDGGALSITVLDGPQRHKRYGKTAELAESVLLEIAAMADS